MPHRLRPESAVGGEETAEVLGIANRRVLRLAAVLPYVDRLTLDRSVHPSIGVTSPRDRLPVELGDFEVTSFAACWSDA